MILLLVEVVEETCNAGVRHSVIFIFLARLRILLSVGVGEGSVLTSEIVTFPFPSLACFLITDMMKAAASSPLVLSSSIAFNFSATFFSTAAAIALVLSYLGFLESLLLSLPPFCSHFSVSIHEARSSVPCRVSCARLWHGVEERLHQSQCLSRLQKMRHWRRRRWHQRHRQSHACLLHDQLSSSAPGRRVTNV